MVTQEMAEEANNEIIAALDTARVVVFHEYDEIDDEWYRSFMTDLGEMLFYLRSMVRDLNDLRYPVHPGKFGPLLADIKKELEKGTMLCQDIGGYLECRDVPDDDIRQFLRMLEKDPDVERTRDGFRLSKGTKDRNAYLDDDGMYREGMVRDAAERMARELNLEIGYVFCNNPFGSRVEVQLKCDESSRICDMMELRNRLEKELGTLVGMSVEHDVRQRMEIP